jgi:CRP/FNR family transcriptional regulator
MRSMGCPCSTPCEDVVRNSGIFAAATSVRFRRGAVLWTQGAPADRILSVCSGTLKLVRERSEGSVLVDVATRGDIVGESAATRGASRPMTCTALSDGRALALSAERLRAAMDDDPRIARSLLEVSIRRSESVARHMDVVGIGPVEQRLARVILRLGGDHGLHDGRGLFVPLRLTRTELADLVGCRMETAVRILTRWRTSGMLDTRREGITIADLGQLEAVAA